VTRASIRTTWQEVGLYPLKGRTIRQLAIGASWPNQHSNRRNYPHGADPQFEHVNEFERSLPLIVRLAHTKKEVELSAEHRSGRLS
jgi:hypothetical protein